VIFEKDFDEAISKQAAKNLGMSINRDGFLIHRFTRDEEKAQKMYNDEYNRLVKERA